MHGRNNIEEYRREWCCSDICHRGRVGSDLAFWCGFAHDKAPPISDKRRVGGEYGIMQRILAMHFAVVAFAVVLCLISTVAYSSELAHRWSFNGDWTDSVGGSDAVKCGKYVSLYGNKVHMGYGGCSWGTGHVDLGTNMLDTTEATIEIWARHDGVQTWSRIFDYGADNTHYFYVGWSRGATLASERVEFYNYPANPATIYQDNTMGSNPFGYEIGRDYHVAVMFRRQGDGSTSIRWQRRDAATGNLLGTGTMTATNGIHTFVNPVLYLGHSQYTSDKDALAAYDEVRLWRGVLTDAQLAASAVAGPDATISMSAGNPSFVAAPAPEPPAQRAAVPNGGIRLMTYNVQFCYDENNTIVPDRTAARILAENPDFCCINEVRDTNQHPEATVLAKLMGMHKTFYANLLLSREEPIKVETYDLPWASYSGRGLLVCEFSNVVVAVTHLDVSDPNDAKQARLDSVEIIRNALAKYASGGKPVFLCGDLNCKPTSTEIVNLKEFMTILSPVSGGRTYHGHKATGGSIIDYISVDSVHADDIYLKHSEILDDIVTSDHNPVIAEVYLRPAVSGLGWIDESFLLTGRTGTWKEPLAWNADSWKGVLSGEHIFTPNSSSGGSPVTVNVKISYDSIPIEYVAPDENTQAAIWIGMNGCFQVWTRELIEEDGELRIGAAKWVDVEADGVTPTIGVDYTFRFTFDYAAKTYSVDLMDETGEAHPFHTVSSSANPEDMPLVTSSSAAISSITLKGNGVFTSMSGEYVAVEGFSESETVLLKDNASVILDAAKAAWLNSCAGGKTATGSAAAGLSSKEFADAYLLNLDITNGDCSYSFEITDVDVGEESVTIAVALMRGGKIEQRINGRLVFYGAATLEAFKNPALVPLGGVTLSDDDFSEDDTATALIPVGGEAKFYKAAIEEVTTK